MNQSIKFYLIKSKIQFIMSFITWDSSKTNTWPISNTECGHGHKLKDWVFGIPAHIQSKSR